MKLIEAMKLVKELQAKAEDLRGKVALHCALLDFETPTYHDQADQVARWIQAHGDISKEVLRLRLAIQRTNLATDVTIELGGKYVVQSIAAWIHRRRDLANQDRSVWEKLSDRGLKEQKVQSSPGGPITEIKLRRFFDPAHRDSMIELYRTEPGIIDRTLEVVNATTDLIEA